MDSLRLIDLNFGGAPHAIGVYLVETTDGLALFDCGPTSTLPALEAGLAEHGLALEDSAICSSRTSTSITRARRGRSCAATRI